MKMRVTGVQELVKEFDKAYGRADEMAKLCVKEGIGIVTDHMRTKISSLKVSERNGTSTSKRYCRQWEKDAMLSGLGYTPNRTTGTIEDRKSGFDDYYTSPKGRKVAIRAIANSVNTGTSFMNRQAIFGPVMRSSRAPAIAKMQEMLDKELQEQGFTISK